jgi:hypothetical protein
MAAGLNGRVSRLEATLKPQTDHCRACGLRHVRPLTMDLVRRIIGSVSLPALAGYLADKPVPKLCLCDPCCGDPKNRGWARMSHGLDDWAV